MSGPDPREAFEKLMAQLQGRARQGGSVARMPGRAFFGGSGLLVLLIAGGLAINASIYNGAHGMTSHR